MRVVLIVAAFLLLLSGITFSRIQNRVDKKTNQNQILSQNSENASIKNDQHTQTDETKNINPLDSDTKNTPTPKPTLQPTSQPTTVNKFSDLYSFIYPGSEIISSDSDSLHLKTMDDPERVTDWYQEKIKSLNMNVRNFIKTKTNDNVLNKLVAAKSGLEIRIEVKKNKGIDISDVLVDMYFD